MSGGATGASKDERQERLFAELSRLSAEGFARGDVARELHLKAMMDLAGSSRAALARDTFDPGHFTASAFVLSPDSKSLLLIFHKKLKMWLQPGGHIEVTDSDLVESARREVCEETGLSQLEVVTPLFDIDVHHIPAWGTTPAHLHHDVRCLFRASELEVKAGDDVADARWFDIEELARRGEETQPAGALAEGFDTDGSVTRVAARLRAIYPEERRAK